eukprot:Plantae.Rhodophyta-Purpureofilum_apyrenoidigerum.ctg14239.p1 GENE.Plantae.Rhodophyta-Purpureofilum_apyrenoidigerum.ctg14239~~Plantae.Rhodophyta-Purpureofilum_apyrenoidigerum.ctg14239.p1  ORF type:complete len:546 (+),score=115.14 Plantae.Rhodophyta-Purpureofilum_apyrenoidigerum.ctg14239:172-1809(+)
MGEAANGNVDVEMQGDRDVPTAIIGLEMRVDHLYIPNPLAVIYEGDPPVEVGRSPLFRKMVNLKFYFHKKQQLRIVIYNFEESIDTDSANLQRIGSITTTLGRLISLGTSFVTIDESAGVTTQGTLKVKVHFVSSSMLHMRYEFKLSGENLDRKDFGGVGRSDPYFVVHRADNGNILYRSEFVQNTLAPEWRHARFDIHWIEDVEPFDASKFRIQIVVYDKDFIGIDDLIGVAEMTLAECKPGVTLDLINDECRHKRKYTNSGTIYFAEMTERKIPSFGEYLCSGFELWTGMVFDFTQSNVCSDEPRSLHHLDESNVYLKLVDALCPLLLQYDPDNEVDAYGFAGKMSPSTPTLYDFPLNGNSATCKGMEGVKAAYEIAAKTVHLSSPTKVVPVLQKFVEILKQQKVTKTKQRYLVIIIIADGVPVELDQFRQKLVELSILPISVVYVGVGTAPFHRLKKLCAMRPIRESDDVLGKRASHYAFMFRQLKDCKESIKSELDPEELAKRQSESFETASILAEEVMWSLPGQIVDFFASAKVQPYAGK